MAVSGRRGRSRRCGSDADLRRCSRVRPCGRCRRGLRNQGWRAGLRRGGRRSRRTRRGRCRLDRGRRAGVSLGGRIGWVQSDAAARIHSRVGGSRPERIESTEVDRHRRTLSRRLATCKHGANNQRRAVRPLADQPAVPPERNAASGRPGWAPSPHRQASHPARTPLDFAMPHVIRATKK